MIALVPVREGVLPAGADETIAECGGRVVLAGSDVAAVPLDGLATDVRRVELGPFAVARWTTALVPLLTDLPDADEVVLPASPDGRDLAPWLAAALGRQLLAGATTVTPAVVYVARGGGLELHQIHPDGPFVATLQPGVRGTEPFQGEPAVADCPVDFTVDRRAGSVDVRRHRGRRAPTRRPHDGSGRGAAHRRWRCRTRLGGAIHATRTVRPGHRRCDGGHPRDHRPRLGQPRPPDRYHRSRRRPDPVRVVRCERRGAAHERAGCPGAHHQRQHRAALPDDGDVGSGDRERRQRDARPSAGSARRTTSPIPSRSSTS